MEHCVHCALRSDTHTPPLPLWLSTILFFWFMFSLLVSFQGVPLEFDRYLAEVVFGMCFFVSAIVLPVCLFPLEGPCGSNQQCVCTVVRQEPLGCGLDQRMKHLSGCKCGRGMRYILPTLWRHAHGAMQENFACLCGSMVCVC